MKYLSLAALAAIGAIVLVHHVGHSEELCVAGHPAKRRADVTYGGLTPRYGFERDHWVPLCLGGADVPSNVWYQPLDQARRKDVEERELCEAYCRGDLSLEEARRQISEDWPR